MIHGIAGDFETFVSTMFLKNSSFVPSWERIPLVSPEIMRCRIVLPRWLFNVLQQAISGILKSKLEFQRHFQIQHCFDLEEFFQAVYHMRG
jgi:hypothetical protein